MCDGSAGFRSFQHGQLGLISGAVKARGFGCLSCMVHMNSFGFDTRSLVQELLYDAYSSAHTSSN